MPSAPDFSPQPSRWRHVLAASLTLALCVASAQGQSTGRVRQPNSFHAINALGEPAPNAANGQVVRDTLTAAEAKVPMHVHLPMRLRNSDELERRVMANEIISRDEMAARFLPVEKDYQAVADWLTSQGLTVKPAGASRAAAIATGTAAQVEKAFDTHLARVQFRGEEHTSATVAPTLPAEIAARVQGVHGLQPHLHPRKMMDTPSPTHNGYPPFRVGDVTNVYDVPAAGLDGSNQAIGIIIDYLPLPSDLKGFWEVNEIPQNLGNVTLVDVNNFGLTGDPEEEATLDTEWSSSIAPAARVIVYAAGGLDFIEDSYVAVLDDLQAGTRPHLHQISMSFGGGEVSSATFNDYQAVHNYFEAMSAYGVSLFASSGDEGAYGTAQTDVEANYPATDPLITAVGATALVLTATDQVLDEQGWSVEGSSQYYGYDSSGGGISVVFSRPAYQVGEGVDLTAMRQVPDVAILGDPHTPGYLYYQGQDTSVGGTSLSSPIWVGLCALINQGRETHGLPPIGRLNPLIYPLLGTANFHDITRGTDGVYTCTPGYDLVTGIGSPDFNVLYQTLLTATPVANPHLAFFTGETALGNGVYYLAFPNGNYFGYYSYLSDSNYIYHFDLGYEYVFDAVDGQEGVYLYDFASGHYFYTSPTFPFPYLYDFDLDAVLYYYPDPNRAGHYTTNPRYFYNTSTGQIITL